MVEQKQEQEISLLNIVWKLIFGWRRILVMGVLFAIIFSGLQYARGLTAWKQQELGDGAEEENILSPEDQEDVDDILAIEKQMDEIHSYQQDSILMNLNAYNEHVLTLLYYVDSDYTFNYIEENRADYAKDVVAAYCSYVTSGIIADAVSKKMNTSNQNDYISELITVVGGDAEGRNRNVFEITVVHSDAEILEQIKPIITEALEGQVERISNDIGPHTLKLLTENITVRVDRNLALVQKEKSDIIYNYRTQISTLEAGLNDEQIEVLGQMRTQESKLEGEEPIDEVGPLFRVKYAVLGFVVGILLACMWCFLEALFSTKMQVSNELSELYGIRILGELKAQNKKKRIFHMLDSLLIRWKERNVKQISQEQRIQIISSNLEIVCKKMGIKQIYLSGSEIISQRNESIDKILMNLYDSGIQVHKGGSVVYDAGSIKEMAEIGNVVFVEQIGVSLYDEVEKEIRIAKENGIEILGSIVIS